MKRIIILATTAVLVLSLLPSCTGNTSAVIERKDAITLEGRTLTLLGPELKVGQPCTVIYSTDEEGKALYIDIANPPNLTQGTGTLTEVNVAKSTVTIMTDKGERTFEVDANTGQFLNNEVCSLEDLENAIDRQDPTGCQVIYYTDKDGNLVYIDVTQGTGP